MELVSLSLDRFDAAERGDCWRDLVSKMIHKVEVSGVPQLGFAAEISVRKHDAMSCGRFWSRPHGLRWGRERLADAGAAGYLVSWQIEGEAHIEQQGARVVQRPGSVAIADARRPMAIHFPSDVRRIVAKLPARVVQERLPRLLSSGVEVFQPAGPFAAMLFASLEELARPATGVQDADMEPLAENVCNLLAITGRGEMAAPPASRDLRRQALVRYVRQHACDPDISLERAAAALNVSRRLVQQLLQDIDTSFTRLVTQERLQSSALLLARSAGTVAISQVAYQCGFGDVSHFNHLFKRRYGMSPSDYRLAAASRPGAAASQPA